MPVRRAAEERPYVRWERQRAWAASILTVGLLLFVWPFVRTPPLSTGLTFAHLLVAWVVVVAGLFAMSRALRPRVPRRDDG
ncbi:MAG TPA: hypothetical protein VFL83_04350 [Anaeromyxobacter sp.]|nr:hypothetical protein [Anaeromyxobacter sp.]